MQKIILLMLFLGFTTAMFAQSTTPSPAMINLAADRPVTVSSSYSAAYPPQNITDGNTNTVWGTQYATSSQWFYVDLGRIQKVCGLTIQWYDTYFANAYDIGVSTDGKTWSFVYSSNAGSGGTLELIGDSTIDIRYMGVLMKSGPKGIYAVSEFEVLGPDFETAFHKNVFSVFDLIPGEPVPVGTPDLSFSTEFVPGTEWTAPNLDPLKVFHARIGDSHGEKGWEMRIGKGGQIYSFRTAAGELIPPQEHHGAEWIDEVFQAIATNNEYLNRDYMVTRTFVHQAGTYWAKPSTGALDPDYLDHAWYSPMLADHFDPVENAYYSLVWGQLSHVPSIFTSNVLFYTKIKNLGDGVIELSYIIKNDGEFKVNWLNVPWGGVRESNLPVQLLSNPDGSYTRHHRYFGKMTKPPEPDDMGIYNFSDTGGWFAWTQDESPDSQGLALVFGTDGKWQQPGHEGYWKKAHFKWGAARGAGRDYNVGSVILPYNIEPGEALYYKSYMVLGPLTDIAAKANELASKVEFGLLNIDETSSPLAAFKRESRDGQEQLVKTDEASAELFTYAYPVKGAMPLYLMGNSATGQTFISHDPYQLVSSFPFVNPCQPGDKFYEFYQTRRQYRPYDGNTDYRTFLGYVLPESLASPTLPYNRLFTITTDTTYYPTPTDLHKEIVVRVKQ